MEKLDFRRIDTEYGFNSAFSIKNAGQCVAMARQHLIESGNITNESFYEYYKSKNVFNEDGFKHALKISEIYFNESYDVEEQLRAYFYKRLISDTVTGFIYEVKSADKIRDVFGLDVTYASVHIDNEYSVDLETKLFGVQVKPKSYTYSNPNNIKLQRDQKRNLANHKKYEAKFGKPVMFVYYEKRSEMINIKEIQKYLK